MSIIIQGVDMPKDCSECPCFHYDMFDYDIDGYCKALKTKIECNHRHQPNCPVIEVEDDLISKDKLLELELPDKGDKGIDRLLGDIDCNKAYMLGWDDLMTRIIMTKPIV